MAAFLEYGNDFSKYQGKVDWERVKADGCKFAILRAGYGMEVSQKDPTFDYNHSECIRLGIPVGAYWYAYWSKTPEDEAKAFLSVVGDKRLDMGLWYDVEYEPNITSKDKKTLTDWAIRGLKALEESGRFVGFYSSTDMINNRMEYARLKPWAIWVAQYSSKCTCKADYGIWQFTSSASLDGVNGRVDENRMYVDYPAIIGANDILSGGSQIVFPPPDVGEPEDDKETETYVVRTQAMTKGDAKAFNELADSLGLYVLQSLDIGPMTKGDLIKIEELAENLDIEIQRI